jgi:hypothetical protein
VANVIERIFKGDDLAAVIIRADYHKEGIEFFTPDDFSQQLAYMNRPLGYKIMPHIHNEVQREIFYTQEVLFIKKGKVKIYFYDDNRDLLETTVVKTGDVILLAAGGHGFEMLEQTEMIEVKQGPYAGENDKTRFECDEM